MGNHLPPDRVRGRFGAKAFGAALAVVVGAAHAQTVYYSDYSGDGAWGNAANWGDASMANVGPVPANGATLVFSNRVFSGSGGFQLTSAQTVDLGQNRTAAALQFDAPFSYTLQGYNLTLSGLWGIFAATITVNTGSHTVQSGVNLGTNLNVTTAANTALAFGGAFNAGTRNVTLTNNGVVTFAGAITGSGTISQNATSKSGTLFISGDSSATFTGNLVAQSGTIQLGNSNVLRAATGLTLSSAIAVFDLADHDQTLGAIAFTGGSILTGNGTLTLGGDITTNMAASAATIAGQLNLGGATRTLNVADGAAAVDLEISAALAGTGGIAKTGTGTLLLSGDNSSTGANTFTAGTVIAATNTALGSGNTTIGSGATLALQGGITLASGPLSVVGTGVTGSNGAIDNVSDENTIASRLVLAGTTQIGAATASQLTISGNIAQSVAGSGLTAAGGGTIVLTGSNTYGGATTVAAGTTLIAAANNALGTTGAATTTAVASGGTLALQGGVTISNETITINGTGAGGAGALFAAAGQNTVANQLVLGSAATVAAADMATLVLAGGITDNATASALTKTDAGTMLLTATGSYTGATTIAGGTLALSGANGVLSGTTGVAVNGGTLRLDNAGANNGNRIAATVTLNDGSLQFIGASGGASAETIAITAGTGANNVHVSAGSGQRADLTISNLVQTNNASIAFFDDNGTLGSGLLGSSRVFLTAINGAATPGNATTAYALPGWILVGSDFAEYTGSTALGGNGVRAVKSYDSSGTGLNVNLGTANVLLDSAVPSAAYALTRSTDTSTTTDGNLKITDLNSGSGASVAVLTGNRTLVLAGGGIVKSAGTNNVLESTLGGATGKLQSGAANLSVMTDPGTKLTIDPIIQNYQGTTARGLVKGGAGTLVLTGTNTYTGTTYLNDGTLQIAREQNLGAVTADLTFGGSATLAATGTFTTNTGKIITLGNNTTGTFDVASGQTLTIAGTTMTAGAGSVLNKTNTGALVIASNNAAFAGAAAVSDGTLELRAATALGTGRTITVVGGVLRLVSDTATAFASNLVVGGDATVWVDRAAAASNLTHTLGTVSIGSQTLTMSGANGFDLKFGAVTLTGDAVFNPNVVGDDLSLGAVSGSGSFSKSGAANLTLTAAATYSGATTVGGGTLYTGANYLPAATALTIAAGAKVDTNGGAQKVAALSGAGNAVFNLGAGTLTVGDSTSTVFSGTLAAGTFTKIGSGSLTLSGTAANAITTFQVNDGTLVAAKTGGDATGTGAVTVGDNTGAVNSAVLRLDVPNQINDASAVTINGDGRFDLNSNGETVASIAGNGSIALGGATLTLLQSAPTTYSGGISGSGGLVKSGTGTLTLSGISTYSGPTTISQGTIVMTKAAALGSGAGGVTVASGAALNIQGSIIVGNAALAMAGNGSGAGALNNVSGTNSWGGQITLTGAVTIGTTGGTLNLSGGVDTGGYVATFASTGTTQISGAIIGAGSVAKTGSGVLVLGATGNSYSGATTISAGSLQFGTNNAGPAASAVNLAATGTALNLNNYSGTVGSLAGVDGSSVTLGSGSLTAGGDNSSTTLASAISGTGAFTKTGTGTTTIAGTATNSLSGGFNVNDGAVILSKTPGLDATGTGALRVGDGVGAAGSASVKLGALNQIDDGVAVTIGGDGKLDLNNNSERFASLAGSTGSSVALGSATLTVGASNASTIFNGSISGSGGVIKEGTGTLTLGGTSSFTGATTINGGTLALAASNAISSTASLTISSGSGLTLAANVSQAVAGLSSTATSSIDLGTNATLTVNAGATTTLLGSLTGTGTLAYLNGGTLALNSTLSFGTLVLGGTGTTTLQLGSYNLTVDTLHITGSTILDFGSSAATRLTAAHLIIDAGASVSVIGWVNMSDYFIAQDFQGATLNTRGTAPENQITFQGYTASNTAWSSFNHEVTPAPEPETYGALLIAAAVGVISFRRWRLRRAQAF